MRCISYRTWIEDLGYDADNRRNIKGIYKNVQTGKTVSGDNFNCVKINNDAEQSYKKSLEYYNETKTEETDADRIFVSAKWE